ncbi:MAG: tail fiber domain-containing protein [Sphingobacteriales bacterium]|nr:tail fiber domain-containing protein [Sphingobacteriales bacterium]
MKKNIYQVCSLIFGCVFVGQYSFAQNFILDVYGNAKIRGRMELGTTTGNDIYIGINAGAPDNNAATTGNIGIGRGVLYNNNRSEIVAIGDSALYKNGTGATIPQQQAICNTAVGSKSLYANTVGSYNTANGYYTLRFNTTGIGNTANGYYALRSNTFGYYNTANGHGALSSNTTGNSNTANGKSALSFNTTGSYNIANGYYALYSNTTGDYNTATGMNALYSNTTGYYNTANGMNALYSNTTGYYNTANGRAALTSNTIGYHNTGIGNSANVSIGNLSFTTAIGYNAVTNANRKHVIGSNLANTVIGGYANWSNLSDGRFKDNVKENVPGLEFINQLRPVTYTINIDKLQHHITAQMPDSIAARYYPSSEEIDNANQEIRTGFIAQEVEATAQKIGYNFDGINAPTNPTDNYSIEYAGFVPSLVKAVQEQQETISAQQNDLTEKDKRIEQLEERLARLEALLSHTDNTGEKTHSISTLLEGSSNETPQLFQNVPNPFNGETNIGYFLPSSTKNAQLRITNALGQEVKTVELSETGNGNVKISTRNLPKGTYIYELLINSERIDAKTMILK